MAYPTDPAPSSRNHHSTDNIDSPRDPDHAPIRLRFLVPNPSDPQAVSRRILDCIHDIRSASFSEGGSSSSSTNSYVVTHDQLDDLYLLAHQNLRNISASGFTSLENQLLEISSKLSDVHHAVRHRAWSRSGGDPTSSYSAVPPGGEASPTTSYREQPPPGPASRTTQYGMTGDGVGGRVYGIMDDSRRMWGYPPHAPSWAREYEHREHTRPTVAAPPAESNSRPDWPSSGRRSSRTEESHPTTDFSSQHNHHRQHSHNHHRSEGSGYDVRSVHQQQQHGARRSPPPPVLTHHPSSSSSNTSTRPGSGGKPQRPPVVPFASSQSSSVLSSAPNSGTNNVDNTPASTTLTDSSSKAPSISFLVNPSGGNSTVSHAVSRVGSHSPPSYNHHHRGGDNMSDDMMEVDGHRPHTDSYESHSTATTHTIKGGSGKASASNRGDSTPKRRIRNGACTFCREKKLACRPGPMAEDPNHTGPVACDQCYRRQRTCQHDPEHRRRRRVAIAPKKPALSPPMNAYVSLPYGGGGDAVERDRDERMESEDIDHDHEPAIVPPLPETRPRQPPPPVAIPDNRPIPAPAQVSPSPEGLLPSNPAHSASIPVKDEEVDQLDRDWSQPE